MNMVPDKALYEVLFSRESAAFSGGPFVYTEEVVGSNPTSPTNLFNDLAGIYEEHARFSEPMTAPIAVLPGRED